MILKMNKIKNEKKIIGCFCDEKGKRGKMGKMSHLKEIFLNYCENKQ